MRTYIVPETHLEYKHYLTDTVRTGSATILKIGYTGICNTCGDKKKVVSIRGTRALDTGPFFCYPCIIEHFNKLMEHLPEKVKLMIIGKVL